MMNTVPSVSPSDRRRRVVALGALAVCLVAAALFVGSRTGTSAVATVRPTQGRADVLVEGSVLDSRSKPVPGAEVLAWWVPASGVRRGGSAKPVQMGAAVADGNGAYSISASPSGPMRRAAAANGGWVNFFLSATPPEGAGVTLQVSRQVEGGHFVPPAPVRPSEVVDNPFLDRRRAAHGNSGSSEEMPSVPVGVAPQVTLVLPPSASGSGRARGSNDPTAARAPRPTYCKISYGPDTKVRVSVVEFHNAANARGSWSYGRTADSDIEGGLRYVGGAWSVNGSAHVENTAKLRVGVTYPAGRRVDTYGRSNFLVRNGVVTTLNGSATPAGNPCYGFPSDVKLGTRFASPYRWVGGATADSGLPGAEYIGCSREPQRSHRSPYRIGATFVRDSSKAAKIAAAGDLGLLWIGATSGFSENVTLKYEVKRRPGIWLCGTNHGPDVAGVVHAQNRR